MTDTTPTPRTPRPRSCTARPEPEEPDVPLGIWPVAQQTAQRQRAGRYLPEVARHPGKMLPALARRIVTEYCAPGALVADPMCGIGTTLAEAALLGRRAVGVELEGRWALLAEANLDHMLEVPARQQVEVRRGDARHLAEVCADLAARVDLVVISPPYGCDAGMIDKQAWLSGGRLCPADTLNYSTDKANLGHARGRAYEQAMAEIYAGCAGLVRPGGYLVVVTKNTRRRGAMLDLAGLTVALASAAGFSYLGHVIALHAAIRGGDLVGRPSYWQATQLRHARAKGEPAHLVAHEDVNVFVLPGTRKDPADAH